MSCIKKNKNRDIKYSAHNTFLELPSSGTHKAKIFESQIILKSLRARNPKGLSRIAKINVGKGHPCRREEYLSFNNNYMMYN